jgi:hypothetical protein
MEPDEDGGRDEWAAENEAVARLDNLSEADILARGRKALLARLTAKAEAGTLSHQEAAILRNLLRDNGLVMALGEPRANPKPLPVEDDDLPQFED